MSAPVPSTPTAAAPVTDPAGRTIQIGRQAIFDRDLQVYGYELLYRDAGGSCTITDGDQASSQTLLNAFVEIGLDRITGPYKAFVNLTRRFFVDMPPMPFHPDRVVLEILEDVEVDDVLLAGLANMAAQGFELAMDDYSFQPQLSPILPFVRYIKVEVQPDRFDELERRMPELRQSGARLLAEKVETAEQYDRLKAMGFDFFQGYFFARPNTVRSARVQESSATLVRLLVRLNDPNVPMQEVVDLVSRDPGLSFKVLRYVNSAAVGLRSSVASIQQAVVLMGLARIRAWATLFTMAGLADRPTELVNLGLMRANLSAQLCRLCGDGVPETAYLVGLMSVLDAMLDRPMDQLMAELPLSDDVRHAITQRHGGYGALLQAAVTLERGEWPHGLCGTLRPAAIVEAYAASSEAAFRLLELINDD